MVESDALGTALLLTSFQSSVNLTRKYYLGSIWHAKA